MAKKQNKQSKQKEEKMNANVIWGTLFLILVFFVSFFLFRGMGTIEYNGLTFVKESIGENLDVYHYYYLYNDKTGQLVQNNIYLRENPKKNDIPVDGGNITYISKKFTYISINASALEGCKNSALAISELTTFLVNGGLQARGAVLDNSTFVGNTTKIVTCNTLKDNPVIQINSGNESKINVNGLCSNIVFSKCDDVLPAVEKYIVQSIIDAKEYSKV